MPIIADALEDEGWGSESLLADLRAPGAFGLSHALVCHVMLRGG
jgi:hypothetical protein